MERLDVLLQHYEKERQQAKTLQEFREANKPGNKTQTEKMVRAMFAGMSA